MSLPKTYTKRNDTGCCAVPNISEWDEKEITFKDKKFIRMYTRSIFYMPLNMSKVMTDIQKQAEDAALKDTIAEKIFEEMYASAK